MLKESKGSLKNQRKKNTLEESEEKRTHLIVNTLRKVELLWDNIKEWSEKEGERGRRR